MVINRPFVKYVATALLAGPLGNNVADPAWMAGASHVVLNSSGASAMTTPTAAQLYSQFPNAAPGEQYVLRVINSSGGTLTLTADASVTASGTMTIAAGAWREFIITFTSSTAATMQSIGTGTNS